MSFVLRGLLAALLPVCAVAQVAFEQPQTRGPLRVTLQVASQQERVTLEPLQIFADDIRIVIGSRTGPDRPLRQRPNVQLYRGTTQQGGSVYLVTGRRTAGMLHVDGVRYALQPDGDLLQAVALPVARRDLPVAYCGTASEADDESPVGQRNFQLGPQTRLLRLAVETDYELYSLFNDTELALAYLAEMYGACSDIFLRDVNTRIELSFIRLWTDPDDRFNQSDPLGNFRNFWEQNMTDVPRDLAQFCSGRRDLPYGGVAYLRGVCNNAGYSVSGYNLGFVLDPERVHGYNRDIIINAHELGHNFNARHAHDYGYDVCQLDNGTPERGTIMSYCGQTRTGGDGNIDLRFDARIASIMRNYVQNTCVARDCNADGLPDPNGVPDLDENGIPDECEDCNNNGIPDPNDIAGGMPDLDLDGIPDECQPDCNNNGLSDRYEISFMLVQDLDFNAVPDDCQEDCDGNGVIDVVQVSDDMTQDVDRNAIPDACEDCDGDGTLDQDALQHAYNVWLGVHQEDTIYEFHARTGVKLTTSNGSGLGHVNDVQIPTPGRVLVSDGMTARIVEYDTSGTYVGDLVSSGLSEPTQMLVDGNSFLVVDRGAATVLRFDLVSGALLETLIGPGPLTAPFGITRSPRGTLCISEADGRVLEFAADGSLLGELVTLADNGGLTNPHGLVFTVDGRLLVCSRGTDQVLEYNGDTGAYLRQFNIGGTNSRLTMDQPFCIRVGPDNDIYVSRHAGHDHDPPPGPALHLTDARIFHFDQDSGFFVRAYVVGNDNNIGAVTGFAFHPGLAIDCNFNQVPDNCDLALGLSTDLDNNGLPDECDCLGDVDADLDTDLTDLAILLANFGADNPTPNQGDLDGNGVIDISDLALLLQTYAEPCLVPIP